MESTSSSYDAASSSSSCSSTRRHRSTGTSRRPANLLHGAEPCASSSSDPAEHVSGSRTRHGHDNGNLGHDYSKQWNIPPFDWIKAFLVALFVLLAVSSSHRDALTPAESVWHANDTHGSDLCTSARRSKRRPDAAGNKQPGTPCWTGRMCQQSAQAADADHEGLMCSSDNAGELVQWSGWQHDDDNVRPVVRWYLEGSLLALQSEDESTDSSSSSTITDDDLLGGEDDVSSMETDHADDAASVTSGHTSIPGAMDGSTEEITGFESSTDAAGDQTSFGPLSSIPGLRFVPTDLEIALHWLKRKILNSELPEHDTVRDGVYVHRTNADKITLNIDDGGKERLGFFFVRKEHAYTNGCWYPTPGGYWKLRRGQPAAIWDGGRVVAFKTSMEYVRGRAPRGRRTPWRMSEYALNACYHDLTNLEQPTMNSFVVCKVWKRTSNDVKKKTSVLRRFGLKRRADKDDRAPKPKVRRLIGGGARDQKLGKLKRPES